VKLHRSTAQAVVDALTDIFAGNRYADKVVERVLKLNPKWGARDRRFIAETTYDVVRWYRLLREVTQAGEHEFWKLLAAWCMWREVELPNWDEFRGMGTEGWRDRWKSAQEVRALRESVSDWMDEWGTAELGPAWDRELHALNQPAAVVLRANTLKVLRKDLQRQLLAQRVETEVVAGQPDALVLKQRQNVFQLDAFKNGWFEVQDAGSQAIAPFLRVEPGMRVVDACAGGGGKTLHLAALMGNKGRIIAMDTEAWKLEELKKRARRADATTIETRVIESSKTIKRLEGAADRVLLDVPCSGLGVLKRNPDAKWKLTPDFINRIRELQHRILSDYSIMVKPGGYVVYSTCSLLPSENEQQVQRFLQNSESAFTLIEEKKILPSQGFDGFYMALLQRA
jgi:16S rRNA (cytosine967-C5)-methyltransferase